MTWAMGGKGVVGMDFEATFGTTPVSPAGKKMPINKSNITGKQAMNNPSTITGSRNPVAPSFGNIDVNGSLEVPLTVRDFGWWLKGCFGAPVTTDVSTAGSLAGATGVTETIETWTAVSDGAFKIAIDGSAATAVGSIDFSSGVTTMAQVASKIQAAVRAIGTGGFTLATVAWDDTEKKFTITSGTAGALSSVSQLTAPASGTNIGGTGFMKCTAGTLTAGVTAYSHVYKVGDTMPSLVIEQGFTDVAQYFLYNGCKIGKLGLSFGGDGELVASIDVMGAKETLATTSFDTTLTTMVFDRFANFQAAILEGGSAIANCTEASIDVEFGLDGNTYCIGGAGFRSDIAEGIVAASGSIKAMFQNAALLTKAMNGTESSLKITLTNGAHSLEILIPELVYERATPGIEGPAGVFVTLPFKGYYQNGADASVIKVTLINDVASYA